MVTHTVDIGELHLLAAEHDALEEIVGSEAEVVVLTGSDAADGHLNVGGHARGSLELTLANDANVAVVVDGVPFAELNYGNFCHNAAQGSRLSRDSQDFFTIFCAIPCKKDGL